MDGRTQGPPLLPNKEGTMRWFKKILLMALVLLIGLGIAWGFLHFKEIKEKTASFSSAFLGKIPLIGKYFKPKEKEAEKTDEEKAAEEEKKEEVFEVKAFKVAQTHFTDILPTIGTIKGYRKINLRFEVNGLVNNFNFREGDLIEEGDIIAEIVHKDSELKVKFREAKLSAAESRMHATKKKYEQHEKLFDIGAIIKSKLQEIEFEYKNASEEHKAAQVELESAKSELEKTYMRSPIDGVMETKDIEEGEFVTSSIQVASLGDISEVYLELGIIEKDLEKVNLGQLVKLKVDTYPDEEFEGEIDNIFPAIEAKSRTLTVRAKIPNPYNKLLSGMFARGQITVYEKEDAVVAPPMGIDKTQEGYRVFIINTENVITSRLVDVEYQGNPEYWVIAEGLAPDELMVSEVISGQFSQLKDEGKVEVLETEEYTL